MTSTPFTRFQRCSLAETGRWKEIFFHERKLEKRFARPEIKMPHMRTSVLKLFNIKSIPQRNELVRQVVFESSSRLAHKKIIYNPLSFSYGNLHATHILYAMILHGTPLQFFSLPS